MSALDDRRRLEELYLPSPDEFVLVDVPDLQFVMIDGEGDPAGEAFAQASTPAQRVPAGARPRRVR